MVVFNASTSPMKERYAVSDSNVIKLAQPGVFTDSLTEVLRSGARALLTQAVEAEVAEFLAKYADLHRIPDPINLLRAVAATPIAWALPCNWPCCGHVDFACCILPAAAIFTCKLDCLAGCVKTINLCLQGNLICT